MLQIFKQIPGNDDDSNTLSSKHFAIEKQKSVGTTMYQRFLFIPR